MEKRENKSLIQSECTKVLGIPVLIDCEIDERAAADNADRRAGDASVGMASADDNTGETSAGIVGDSGRTGDSGAGTAGENDSTDYGGAMMAADSEQAEDAEAEMTDGNAAADDAGAGSADIAHIDRADTTGAGLDEYPGSAEESVSEAQETTAADKTGGQAANIRASAAKDPAVRKIVEAFDGQIMTD